MTTLSPAVYETIRQSRELPSPTGVALQILELSRHESTTAAQIALAVKSDPSLSSRLLKLVNSSLAGMPRQIVSIERAVALLGNVTIRNLALGFSLVSNHRGGRCASFDYDLFWSESLARAVAAREAAGHNAKFAPDEAFACGLLSQIGRLALAAVFPKEYADVLEAFAGALDTTLTEGPHGLAELERAAFDIDHDELAAAMMADWHIPSIFCEAVRSQSHPIIADFESATRTELLSSILFLSGSISLILTQPTIYHDILPRLSSEAGALGFTSTACHEMFDTIAREWREAGTILDVRTRQVPPLAELYAEASRRQTAVHGAPAAQTPGTIGGEPGAG